MTAVGGQATAMRGGATTEGGGVTTMVATGGETTTVEAAGVSFQVVLTDDVWCRMIPD